MATVTNRFVATSEKEAEGQLKVLYGVAPIRAGVTPQHVTWYVKNRYVKMHRRSHHRNGANQPLFVVEVM